MKKMQHSQMPFCEVVNNLVCVTGYDIPSFPLLIGNQMCAFCEREIHMHLLGEFCAKLFYNLGSLSPHSCPYVEYPRVLDAFPQLAMRSEWKFLKHRGTLILWRCSLFFFFLTVLSSWLVQCWSLFTMERFGL